jgi:hypothetical protein
MLNQQKVLPTPADGAVLKSAVIAFDPEQIVQAIRFHLLDDQHASRVSTLSLHQTRDRLRRGRVRAVIARRQWESLNNRERLEWLLTRSKTVAIYSGDAASLAPQK